ncbi:CocE/NonD family hydrolase [Alteromonas sediminis]|uniref:CocE/NonD family hydrolase n=1 Tax=Alteromonas sediminis TaxID=2259342 RepID=A0A3N5YLZ6_9ALTE|nr:CocE/NonD family hydrolase [Alteromonas sediminis]RPJ66241.1 CocE/NonD family hydrolase [Alteromonas sediminis]
MTEFKLYKVIIIVLMILLNLIQKTYADDTEKFALPKAIANADLSNENALDNILNSESFKQELALFAASLTLKDVEEQNMFNKVALLSLRNDGAAIEKLIDSQSNTKEFAHYQFFHQTKDALGSKAKSKTALINEASRLIQKRFSGFDDEEFVQMSLALGWSLSNAKSYAHNIYKQLKDRATLSKEEMIVVAVNTHLFHVLEIIIPISAETINAEQERRFIVQPDVLVKLDGGIELSTTIVRSRGQAAPNTTALQFTIYADEAAHIKTAMHAAAHGFIGMVANSRGKRSSKNKIVPWEHEGKDAAQLIDWITEQVWSDGKVVMYGGSYNGFTQWATAKHMPKGLKAIAPYAAANIITGLPYENNIALTDNFEWPLFVTNNKTLDNTIYRDWQRTQGIVDELYTSGRPITDIDKIANTPSPWLQKWLAHPEDDEYYQSMVPHEEEYGRINIPVLSITGYFEGGQISALHYFHEHYKYNEAADHSLLIGPYNHWSAQNKPRSHHSNYELDPVALEKDTEEVVFEWFNYVLHGKKRPKLVQAKVNYQVMGANEWRYADSIETLNQHNQTFYIQSTKPNSQQNYVLGTTASKDSDEYIEQTIDLADRTEQRNSAPWPVIQSSINKQSGIQIETPVFEQDMELTGAITGFFDISINKKDVDLGFNYYEVTADGEVFHLNTYRSRASYADDISKRRLLTPNQKRRVPIVNARFTSKLIRAGSKIVLVLNVNKNVAAQVNLGTGKTVNHEHISDAGEPLALKWYLSSRINLPLKAWQK